MTPSSEFSFMAYATKISNSDTIKISGIRPDLTRTVCPVWLQTHREIKARHESLFLYGHHWKRWWVASAIARGGLFVFMSPLH